MYSDEDTYCNGNESINGAVTMCEKDDLTILSQNHGQSAYLNTNVAGKVYSGSKSGNVT